MSASLRIRFAALPDAIKAKGEYAVAKALAITRHQARKVLAQTPAAPLAVNGAARSILQAYDDICTAIERARLIEDVLPLLDQIEHVKLHARKVRDRRLLAEAAAGQNKAERRLGEIIVAARQAGHFRQGHRAKNPADGFLSRAVLADVGVTTQLASRAQKLAALGSKEFAAANETLRARIIAGSAKLIDREEATAEKQRRRASRERIAGLAMPAGKFGVIVEDFEWDHETWSEKGRDRAAENHYAVSTDAHSAAEIVERTKERFACAAENCVLFTWCPLQHAAVAIDVLRLRGFDYRSQYAWGKDKAGLGYWSREKHEILLIGVKGSIDCPAPGTQWDSLIMAPRREHSRKPECFLEMIEQYFPTLRKIELNRRGPARPGWAAWGAEVEK